MARPIFIVCSNGVSIDRATNFLTMFQVLEGYTSTISETPEPVPVTESVRAIVGDIRFFVTAVWMREPEETPEDEFEYELAITSPGQERQVFDHQHCKIPKNFFRITAGLQKSSPWDQAGIVSVECRLRKLPDGEWKTQEFPIPITVRRVASFEELQGTQDD